MIEVKSNTFGQLQNNCYLITDKDTNFSALVDCTEYNDKMINFIKDENIKYILLTHGHFDHIGGVNAVKEKTNCKVVISKDDEDMLQSSKKSLAAFCGLHQINSTADIIVDDNSTIQLGNSTIKVITTPGHTKGGVCYIVDDCIFTGDTLLFCSFGRTDFPGGSQLEIEKSLDKILSLSGDYKVYPGHDRESTLEFERKNNPLSKFKK